MKESINKEQNKTAILFGYTEDNVNQIIRLLDEIDVKGVLNHKRIIDIVAIMQQGIQSQPLKVIEVEDKVKNNK